MKTAASTSKRDSTPSSSDLKICFELVKELVKLGICEQCGKETERFNLSSHYGSDTLLCSRCYQLA